MDVKLKVETEFETDEVLFASYNFSQYTNEKNEPEGNVRGGRLNLILRSNNKNTTMAKWAADTHETKSGSLSFIKPIDGVAQTFERINFTDGYIIEYTEMYEKKGEQESMKEHITIVCREISINGKATFKNASWAKKTS